MPGRTPAGREWQRWLWPGRGYCSTDPALLVHHPPNLLNPAELQWPLYHKEIGTEAFTRLSPRAPPAGPRSIVWRASTACVGQCGFRRPSQAAWRWPLHSVFTWQTPSINAFVCCALKWRCKGEAKRGQTCRDHAARWIELGFRGWAWRSARGRSRDSNVIAGRVPAQRGWLPTPPG